MRSLLQSDPDRLDTLTDVTGAGRQAVSRKEPIHYITLLAVEGVLVFAIFNKSSKALFAAVNSFSPKAFT